MPKRAVWGCVLVAVVVAAWFWVGVVTRPAFKQGKNEVDIRKPGNRRLDAPVPAREAAKDQFTYALISFSAYGAPGPKTNANHDCADPSENLGPQWVLDPWRGFPSDSLAHEMSKVHLRTQLWENKATGQLVVTFGGTVATSVTDWFSNFHWLHPWPFPKDEYTVLAKRYATAFAQELARRMQEPGGAYLGQVHLIATGHSLGGGLAENFAYSLQATKYGTPHVEKVYAFDPSPVTAYVYTSLEDKEQNRSGLMIDRIYERGEFLATVRSIASWVHEPSMKNPTVQQFRYNMVGNDRWGFTDPIASHSIQKLACNLKHIAEAPVTQDANRSPVTAQR